MYKSMLFIGIAHDIAQDFRRFFVKQKCETHGLTLFHLKGCANELSVRIMKALFVDLDLKLNVGGYGLHLNRGDNGNQYRHTQHYDSLHG